MARKWFSIDASEGASKLSPRNEGGRVARVNILGPIGGWDVSGSQFLRELNELGEVDSIDLRIHSPGGEVLDGWAIANGLKNHPAKVVARVEGMAASMGSVIAMAADEVEMPRNAYLMIHNVSGGVWGEAEELRSAADLVEKLQDDIVDFYAERSGVERDEVAEMMRVETWMNGEDAVAKGFAARVLEPVNAAAVCGGIEFAGKFENLPEDLTVENVESAEDEADDETDEGADAPEVEGIDDKTDEGADAPEVEGGDDEISDDVPGEEPKGFLERVKSALGISGDAEEVPEKGPSASVALAASIVENKRLEAEVANVRNERDGLAAENKRLSAEQATVEDLIAQAGFSPAAAADLPSPEDDSEGLGARGVLEEFEAMSAGPERSAFFKAHEGEILAAMKNRA
jgi:ATP-dependent protease ClpP protease subunit